MIHHKPIITINAYEFGRYELHLIESEEYWQVYLMKGKSGSWVDNCETLQEAFERVYEELERRLIREYTDHARTEEKSSLDRDRS